LPPYVDAISLFVFHKPFRLNVVPTMYQPIEKALVQFFAEPALETRRVFHGRGHLFEGLEHINIDWFEPVLLITAYAELEATDKLTSIAQTADEHGQFKSILLQKRYLPGAPVEVLWGDAIDSCLVKEGNLVFEVHPGAQQNAGLFLDMRQLREWLQQHSQDKNVLNLFAYTCSLSVAALAGGAKQVTNVDMSKTSLKWGRLNHRHNNQDLRKVNSIPYNIFKSWGRIKQFGRYDTLIIDPPSRQKGSFEVEKNYQALIKKIGSIVNPDADVIATINSPYLGSDFLIHRFQRYAPQCRFITEMPASAEFEDKYPERALNICHFRHR